MRLQQDVFVLIDYDNVVKVLDDLTTIIDQTIQQLYATNKALPDLDCLFTVRLYGGWDELVTESDSIENRLSKEAQDIGVYLDRNYPIMSARPKYSVMVELARSLANMSGVNMPFTYRTRQNLGRLRVCKKADDCCKEASNALWFLRELHKRSKCPHCSKPSASLVWISEQKLVDSLLSMDMVHYSYLNGKGIVVVVSDDDDFIPAMFYLGNQRRRIIHVQQKSGRCFETYCNLAPKPYYENLSLTEENHHD